MDAQGRAKWPKVGPRSPKWNQNGGPGLPRNRTRTQDPKKRAQCAIRTLFTMFQAHRTYPKKSLFHSGGHPKMKEKLGLQPRSLKNIEKARRREQQNGTGGPQGGPRVGQGLQNEVQIDPKFMEKWIAVPVCTQRAPGVPPELQKAPKSMKFRYFC